MNSLTELSNDEKIRNSVFFKMKSSKRSNPETRTMLDALHNQKVTNFIEEKNNLSILRNKFIEIEKNIKNSKNEIEKWHLEREKDLIEKEVKMIQNDDKIMDYYLRSGEILFNYYEVQDKIKQGIVPTSSHTKAKPGSILAILESIAENENQSVNMPAENVVMEDKKKDNTPQRNDLLNKYLMVEDPEMAKVEGDFEDPWTYCEECGTEMNICLNEAVLTCPKCGFQENILIDSDKPSYKDPPRENSYYAYKKINHFNEWLAQFQAKETTEIPQDIYDNILIELKKERITDMSMLKKEKIKEILRKMNKSKYYEHVTHIINRLNGRNAPHMSRENEEKLRHMFREIQPSFVKHKPKGRRNFLSYSYVFYKFCELLEMDEFLSQFSLLKNRDKLYLQDQTWKLICQDMGWQYIRTLG
jgi:hypothetical protein